MYLYCPCRDNNTLTKIAVVITPYNEKEYNFRYSCRYNQ